MSKDIDVDIRIIWIEMRFYLYYAELFEEDVLLKPISFLNKIPHFKLVG